MYDSVPAFKLRDVAPWAVKHYPKTFPYRGDPWAAEAEAETLKRNLRALKDESGCQAPCLLRSAIHGLADDGKAHDDGCG